MNRAVLTIDDIASKNTPAIVDYLCEKQIKAVMFAVGANVERYYEEAVYTVKKGMIVGNHSYSHPAFSSIPLEKCVEEIEKTEEILNRLYHDAGVERTYRPFRFPYGDKGGDNHDALQTYLKQNGFDKLWDKQITYPWYTQSECYGDIDTFWTFDFAEYQIRPGSDFTKESVFEKMHDKHPGAGAALFSDDNAHILLLHAHDETEALVPEYYKQFLDYAMECGVTFEKPVFEKDKKALHEALLRLKKNADSLCRAAGKEDSFAADFWEGLLNTDGMLREFAYYCDNGKFLCEKKIAGQTIADVMVWQVDHFKAYLDRGEDCLRYDSPKLLLSAFDIMLKMDQNPEPYLKKIKQESGTDSPEAFF